MTDLTEELAQRIALRDGDRRRRVSKQRALIMVLIQQGLDGDSRAIGVLLQLLAKIVGPAADSAPTNDELSADDVAILDDFIDRELRARQTNPGRVSR